MGTTVFNGNISALCANLEREISENDAAIGRHKREIEGYLDNAEASGESRLSAEADARSESLFIDIERLGVANRRLEAQLARAREVEAEETRNESRLNSFRATNAGQPSRVSNRTTSVRVGQEPRVYNRGNDPVGKSFLSDVARHFVLGDVMASDRLARHMREEAVERPQYATRAAGDETTSSFSGLVVPQYLVDMVAPATAAMRPFADACTTKHNLPPDGMNVNISRVTTPTSAGLQATQLTALSTQTASDTLLTVAVQTAGGYVNVSRQAIDRGTGIDETLLQDLFNRYNSDLDNQLLNQATTGALAVGQNTDVVTAGFTPQILYSKILGGVQGVSTALQGLGFATHCVMHPRRWNWLSAQTTNTWPLVSVEPDSGPGAGLGTMTSQQYGKGVVGNLPNGLLVVTDYNIPTNLTADAGTNEDAILVVPQMECHLWEDPNQPAYIRAEQPNSPQLGVLLVVFGYYAYSYGRYTNCIQKLTGSAFSPPTF